MKSIKCADMPNGGISGGDLLLRYVRRTKGSNGESARIDYLAGVMRRDGRHHDVDRCGHAVDRIWPFHGGMATANWRAAASVDAGMGTRLRPLSEYL